MRVGCLLDEHERRQVVEVPVCRDFDQSCLRALAEGVHPGLRAASARTDAVGEAIIPLRAGCTEWASKYLREGQRRGRHRAGTKVTLVPEVVALTVMCHRGVVILNAVLEQQLNAIFADLPPGRNDPGDLVPVADERRELLVRLVEHGALLLQGHRRRVLVRVAM
jgi:hypothetical protein